MLAALVQFSLMWSLQVPYQKQDLIKKNKTKTKSLSNFVDMHVNGSEELRAVGSNLPHHNAIYDDYIQLTSWRICFAEQHCGNSFGLSAEIPCWFHCGLHFHLVLEDNAGSFKPP